MSYSIDQKNNLKTEICKLISTNTMGIHKMVAEYTQLPAVSTIMLWLEEDNNFSEQYARAKEIQHDLLAEEIISISDDDSNDVIHTEFGIKENKEFINRSKLRVDSRKWLLAKLSPKKYGDRVDVTTNGKELNALPVFNLNINSSKSDFASSEDEVK